MEPKTPVAKVSSIKRAKSADPPTIKKKMSGFLKNKSLKTMCSEFFNPPPPVPAIRPEDITVPRDEYGNTYSHWPPKQSHSTKYYDDGRNDSTPYSYLDSSRHGYCPPPNPTDDEGPPWLSSPTLTSMIPPGPFSPVTGTSCFAEPSRSMPLRDSGLKETEGQCFGIQTTTLHGYNGTAQSSHGFFSIINRDEEPFIDEQVRPLRVNKKRESPNNNLSHIGRDEYYPSVAPLSTPKRRLASNNASRFQERNPALEVQLEYPESPLHPHLREAMNEACYIPSGHPKKSDDNNDDASSCYSMRPEGYCPEHQSRFRTSFGAVANHADKPVNSELDRDLSSQVTTHQELVPHCAKNTYYRNPYFNYAEQRGDKSSPNSQGSIPVMGNKNKPNLNGSRRETPSSRSMSAQRDSVTLVGSPSTAIIPPIPGPNVAPFPALSSSQCSQKKGNRGVTKAKFTSTVPKRAMGFLERTCRQLEDGLAKLRSKRHKEDDQKETPELAEARAVEHQVDQLILQVLARGRDEPTTREPRVPNAWIYRNESGYFEYRSNQITEQAMHHPFHEMLLEPSVGEPSEGEAVEAELSQGEDYEEDLRGAELPQAKNSDMDKVRGADYSDFELDGGELFSEELPEDNRFG